MRKKNPQNETNTKPKQQKLNQNKRKQLKMRPTLT